MPAVSGSPSSAARANLYYLYCALYSAPLLRSGFDLDGYSLLMLLLCAAHVQVSDLTAHEADMSERDNVPLAGHQEQQRILTAALPEMPLAS